MQPEAQGQGYVVIDGFRWDPDTGECLGSDKPFSVDSEATLDWVLEKMSKLEADVVAAKAQRAAVLDNLNLIVKRAENRLSGFKFNMDPLCIEFAQTLKGDRQSVVRPFGTIKWRTIKPKLDIVDVDDAVLTLEREGADKAVEYTRKIKVSLIPSAVKEAILNKDGSKDYPGFNVVPGGIKTTVDTGVSSQEAQPESE